ncbi:MAG TPA: LEPR-XLL domain-containing protein, partial [Accumulibacter sp.]|nr:LEPR-XLL domain-containing protein [Accumulibacter sp.]
MRKSTAMNDCTNRQKTFGLAPMVSALLRAFSTLDLVPRSVTKKPPATPSAIHFEAMEPRILLAADPLLAVNAAISTPGEADHYNFTLSSETKVVFDSLTNNASINWSLEGANGRLVNQRSLAASDASGLSSSPAIALAAGDYTIAVNGSMGATGPYGFRLLDLQRADGITYGAGVTGWISPANETDAYKFDATAGDHFFLDVTGRSGGDLTWRLLDPVGQQVFGPTAMNSASQDVDLPSLAASGTYTLLIEGSVGAPEAAFYSFTAQLLPPDNVPAPATTNTWVGPAGGDWNVAANWSKGAVPIATDNVYIGLPTGHAVVVTSGTVTVNSLTCEGDLTLSGGAMMNLNGVSKVKGSLVLAGGTLGGTGALTVVDRLNVTAASTLSGARALITQGVSLITSRLNFHGTWFNQGTLTLSDSGRIVFGAHSGGTNTLVNAAGAMLNLDGSDGEPLAYSSGTAIISNAGRLSHSASGTHSISSGINFHNTGQVTVLAGTLSINGSGRDNGAYNVASDGTCNFGGGTRTLGGFMPVIVEGTGALQVTGGTTYLNSVIVFGSGNFNVAGGTLAGSGTITSNMTLSSGTVGGTGGTLTTAGTSVVTGGISFSGGQTWVNAGVLTVSGGGYINFGANGGGSNTLVNAAGATLNLNSSSSD